MLPSMVVSINVHGIPATKLNYLEKIQELYKGEHFFLNLQNTQIRNEYYEKSIDPDGVVRDALLEEHQWKQNNRETIVFVQEVINHSQPKIILDFGCGPGWLLSSIKTEAQKYGVDKSQLALKSACRFASVAANVDELRLDAFELIIVNHVLEHLSNPVEILSELIQKLTPTGEIIVGMPDFASAMAHRYGVNYRMLNEPSHISLFTLDSTLTLLRKFGIEITRVEFPFFDSPYLTKDNLMKILNREGQSPPFFGNFFLISGRKRVTSPNNNFLMGQL